MPFVIITCPHCNAQHVTFDIISFSSVRPILDKLFCRCRNCKDVVIVTTYGTSVRSIFQEFNGNIHEKGVQIKSSFPLQNEPSAPQDTPKDVAGHFIEGLNVLSVKAYSSAGNCFRRALEKATYHLLEELGSDAIKEKEKNLYSRIKVLRDRSLITPILYEWAEIIREFGNKGSHGDMEFSEKEAAALKNFTGVFLMHVFTMPAEVRRMRDPSSANKTKEN